MGRERREGFLISPPATGLNPKERLIGSHAGLEACFVFAPLFVAAIAGIRDHILWILLEHLQAHFRFDDSEVVVVNISSFR